MSIVWPFRGLIFLSFSDTNLHQILWKLVCCHVSWPIHTPSQTHNLGLLHPSNSVHSPDNQYSISRSSLSLLVHKLEEKLHKQKLLYVPLTILPPLSLPLPALGVQWQGHGLHLNRRTSGIQGQRSTPNTTDYESEGHKLKPCLTFLAPCMVILREGLWGWRGCNVWNESVLTDSYRHMQK